MKAVLNTTTDLRMNLYNKYKKKRLFIGQLTIHIIFRSKTDRSATQRYLLVYVFTLPTFLYL